MLPKRSLMSPVVQEDQVVSNVFFMKPESSHIMTPRMRHLLRQLATIIIDLNMGFAHLSKGNNSSGETVQTKYGETPVGSFLRYQVSFTESNLSAEAHLNFSTPK